MAVTESFLVNTNSFNAIIEALIKLDETPKEITDEFLISLGFESPSDLLVVHMLKELDMVTVDGEPTELYNKMTNPDTTDEAIATGLVRAYTDLFEQNRDFHKLQKEDIHRELNEYFDGRKTDLIIKYMTNTLHKLLTYAGLNNVQKAVDAHFKSQPAPEELPADDGVTLDDEPVLSENGQDESQESDVIVEEEESTVAEDANEEDDSEFDDVFFGEDQEEEEDVEQEEITAEEEKAGDTAAEAKNSKGSINFDELPQVQKEEKGSKNIFDFFNNKKKDEDESEEIEAASETEAVESEAADEADVDQDEIFAEAEEEIELHEEESDQQEETLETESTEKTEEPEESQESLEQELLEINMESTNGYHTNGAETKDNPMANLTNIPTNEKIEKAIIKKAELLYKLERFDDVLPAYNDVISYFDKSDKDHLKEAVAKAVINRVAVLNKLDREEDLLPALDEVIKRFEDSSVTEYYDHASMAMLQKSQLLEDGAPEELLSLYNDIIDRLSNASSPKIKNQVDDIFINRVDILNENGSDNELLDAVEDLIDRFKDSQLQNGQLEQAMYKRAEILENLNRDEEALEAYSEFIEKFGKTKEAV